MFEDFDRLRQQARADGDAARMLAEDGVKPEVGRHYTISPDFVCGDRSWTDAVLRVEAINEAHCVVSFPFRHHGEKRVLTVDDRHWYLADALADALSVEQDND